MFALNFALILLTDHKNRLQAFDVVWVQKTRTCKGYRNEISLKNQGYNFNIRTNLGSSCSEFEVEPLKIPLLYIMPCCTL